MALLKPDIGQDAGTNSARIGAAIDQVNANTDLLADLQSSVSSLTLANLTPRMSAAEAAITQERADRIAGIQQEASDRTQAIQGEATQRIADIQQTARDRDAAIATVRAELTAGIQREGSDRTAGEQRLQDGIQREAIDRTAAVKGVQDDLDAEKVDRKATDAAQDQALADARTAIAADSDAKLLKTLVAVATDALQPGINPEAFTGSATGSIDDTMPLDPAGRIATLFGPAYRISGSGLIAPRAVLLLDPNKIWALEIRYWRLTDLADPNNDALDIGIQWLDASGAALAPTLIQRVRYPVVASGPQSLVVRVPSLVGLSPIIQPPKGAVSWRPYLKTYGSDGATAVQLLGARDVTFSGVFAPNLLALEGRVGPLEGQLKVALVNLLDSRFLVLPGNPTPTDIPNGQIRACKNASTSRHAIWANDGGVMVDYGQLSTTL